MDRLCVRVATVVQARLKLLLQQNSVTEPGLFICSRLIAAARAGVSLDSALTMAAKDQDCPTAVREQLRRIADGNPSVDFLSSYLSSALRTGMPILATLQIFQQVLGAKRKLQLRSRSLTGQARAQAEVLSWLPWGLAFMIFLVDQEWFRLAARHSLTWLLWAVAIALTGLGRQWMKRALVRALEPASPAESLEEKELPELTLRMVAEISMGTDADTALERSLSSVASGELNQFMLGKSSPPEKILQLKSLLRHAALTGAPLREDLLGFLQNLYTELESRWEEKVQRLPVTLLLPLFVCFFPGTLLVLAGLLIPLLQELQ